ncbi:NHL repeat-containing protein [bacterium]|nr:NHL repeat-containing protein [bacterium]
MRGERIHWALLALLLCGCGGGSSYVQFSPDEQTLTRVQSDNGLITALIQPGSLAEAVEIALRDRSEADRGLPGVAGRELALALEISGSMPAPEPLADEEPAAQAASVSAVDGRFVPAVLDGSIELQLSLASAWPTATPLDVQRWNAASGRYEAAGISASPAEDGLTLSFSITDFGRYALYGPLPEEYPLPAPPAPRLLAATSMIRYLEWDNVPAAAGFNLFRREAGAESFSQLNTEVLQAGRHTDILPATGSYEYALAVLRDNGIESELSAALDSPAVDFDLRGRISSPQLAAPGSLLFDNGNRRLLVADGADPALLVFDGEGRLQRRIDRLGTAPMRDPAALAIDPGNGDLYICDRGYSQVFRFNSALDYRSKFGAAGSGPGEFSSLSGICTDGERIVTLDGGRNLLQSFTPLGVYLDAPLDPLDQQLVLSGASGILLHEDGGMAIADTGNDRVLLIDSEFAASSELIRPAGNGVLTGPHSVVADAFGRLFVSEPPERRVSVFDSAGEYSFQFGSEGLLNVEFALEGPAGLAYDPATGYLYVSDPGSSTIAVFGS